MATRISEDNESGTDRSPFLDQRQRTFVQLEILPSPNQGPNSVIADIIPPRKAHLTFIDGLALVVSLQIGSAWLLGGILVYTGAMAFAELGTRIPHNGGIQEYLRHAYGDLAGCVFSWTWVVIVKPSSMAIISMIFSEYLCRLLLPEAWTSLLMEKAVAVLGLALVTFVNCFDVRFGALAANVFLCLKLFTLFSLPLAALIFGFGSGSAGSLSNLESQIGGSMTKPTVSAWNVFGDYVTGFFGVLFCYGGWESIGFVAGEMQHPSRDLPRVLTTAMTCVTLGFVVFNAALYYVVPIQVVQHTNTPVVGANVSFFNQEFGNRLYGQAGEWLYSTMIAISALGALNANVYATSRAVVSAADTGYLPVLFNEQRNVEMPRPNRFLHTADLVFIPPSAYDRVQTILSAFSTTGGHQALRYAMIGNASMVSTYIIGGTFSGLVTFVGISEYIFLTLAVAGILVLRRKSSHNTTYVAPSLYIVMFCTISFCFVLRGIITSPIQGMSIALLVGFGWLVRQHLST